MKICLISLVTENLEKEAFQSTLNKKKYCDKYSLDYKFYVGRMSQRHPQWDKIQCLIQNISHYDYVIWMDSDAVFKQTISCIRMKGQPSDFDSVQAGTAEDSKPAKTSGEIVSSSTTDPSTPDATKESNYYVT